MKLLWEKNTLQFRFWRPLIAAMTGLIFATTASIQPARSQDACSHFIGLTNLSGFEQPTNGDGSVVGYSIQTTNKEPWNELIVSWNVDAPAGTWLKVEARAQWPDHESKFYVLGLWTRDNVPFPRTSVSGQKDAQGDVKVDTLTLARTASICQIRLTLAGTNGILPRVKFLGLAFCNTNIVPAALPPNRAAWGEIIPTPERSQQSYPGGSGWCSPTSLSMVLARWARVMRRADWDLDAPAAAAGVHDYGFYHPTGNWPFNTAFAGSLPGMRAYVTRLSDISELEDWIAAGIPVMISARYDLLKDGRKPDYNGHLTVCRGFTETGDVVINDPWTDPKVESIRHIYKRANVIRAWATSHNTVYLVYPENWAVPVSQLGDW
jgi:hypothetical protein